MWSVYLPIIATQGLAIAEKLWQLTIQGTPPTQAEWDSLKELGKVRAVNLMQQALLSSGVDLNSEEAKKLIEAATTGI